MKKLVLLLAAASILASCSNEKIPGFKEFAPGRFFKLLAPGEDGKAPLEGSFLEVKMYNTIGDSVIYDSELESAAGTMIVPYTPESGFSLMTEGDSAMFLLPSSNIEYDGRDTLMKMSVKLVKVHSTPPALNNTIRNEFEEQVVLKRYISRLPEKPIEKDGLYVVNKNLLKGNKVLDGKTVRIKYTGRFLNGKVFDRSPAEGLEFLYGTQGQVLKGLESGIKGMVAGEKKTLIIPSYLAFGESGSSNGVVKPFQTVIYDVELINVN